MASHDYARMDQLIKQVDRIENALRTLSHWLVSAQTGFGEQDARGIIKILDGEPLDTTDG